jgi:hypothetical protein
MTSAASRLPFGGYAGLDPAEAIAPEEGRSSLSKEVLLEDSFACRNTGS